MLEVCVDSAAGLEAAVAGGADRIELCSALSLGGLTPSAGLMAQAGGVLPPVMAMIRPRAGDFVYSERDLETMASDIGTARQSGLSGVVLGASRPDGGLDLPVLGRLLRLAEGMDVTLHRCFDLVPDMGEALEQAIRLGFRRILTSGGEGTAEAGAARIAELVARAAGRISIMPGSGVTPANAGMLKGLGIAEIHASCSVSTGMSGKLVELGFVPPVMRHTAPELVRALRKTLE